MRASIIIACLIFCGCGHFLTAQDTVTQDMIYKTTVRILSDPSFKCYGALYQVNDSSILISSRQLKDYNSGNVETLRFPVGDLKLIHTRKTGNGGKGAWIGAVSGVALGALFGLAKSATKPSGIFGSGGEMFLGAVLGLAIGPPTGFIVGRIAGHKRIPINGNMDEFNLKKDELKDYAIKK